MCRLSEGHCYCKHYHLFAYLSCSVWQYASIVITNLKRIFLDKELYSHEHSDANEANLRSTLMERTHATKLKPAPRTNIARTMFIDPKKKGMNSSSDLKQEREIREKGSMHEERNRGKEREKWFRVEKTRRE